MTESVYFYVFQGTGGKPFGQLFHGGRPTPLQLRPMPPVVYKRDVTDEREATMTRAEGGEWVETTGVMANLMARYLQAREYGTFPPDNMTPPPRPKDAGKTAVKLGHRERLAGPPDRSGETPATPRIVDIAVQRARAELRRLGVA